MSELVEYASWDGINTGNGLVLNFIEKIPEPIINAAYPILNFTELAFLYNTADTANIPFIKFLFQYEAAYLVNYQTEANIKLQLLFRQDDGEDMNYASPYAFDLDKSLNNLSPDVNIEKFKERLVQLKRKYTQYRMALTRNNELIEYPPDNSNLTSQLEKICLPSTKTISAVLERPSLCLYARIAHHFLRQDNFIDEFMRACTARIDTVEARANATSYTVCPTGEEPTNWFSPPSLVDINLVEPWGNENAKTNMSNWVTHYNGGGTHVITRSVEPLVAALISAYPTTIEFVGKESSIDVAYLRESIINGAWCGRIYDDDKQCHNMLTFLTLLLIASSSGIPMYASRGWTVVSKVWRDMVRTIQGDRWLARYTEATAETTTTTDQGVEINEERLLELAIKVIAITHVSEQKVQGFKPGALGYVRYVEKFYARMVKEDVLGQVKTKPWADEGQQGASQSDNDAKVNDPTLRFARRVRFMQEFSYPRDMDDLRDAVRFRLAHWLVLEPTQIQFV